MPIVVGIDGTGPFFNSSYEAAFKNSFVKRICPPGNPNKQYYRGPIGPGGGLPEAIQGGYQFVRERLEWGGRDKSILLTGYSRGGLGVLCIAELLRLEKISVKAVMLFDAVDRHAAYDADTIPNNVGEVLHVRRSQDSGSRESFGNCGTMFTHPTQYAEKFYRCTHGGCGGTPWEDRTKSPKEFIDEGWPDGLTKITYAEDKRVSDQIWNDIQGFLAKHNFL